MKSLRLMLGVLLLTGTGFAQENEGITKADLPPGPLLARIPEYSQWSIQYTYPKAAQPTDEPPPKAGSGSINPPSQTTITKTKGFFHEVTIDVLGGKVERWFDGRIEAVLVPGIEQPFVSFSQATTKVAPAGWLVDYTQDQLRDFAWISAGNYLGIKTVNERNCLVFGQSGVTAYLDKETRLPVRLESPGEIRDYAFDKPPVGEQSFPEIVQRALETISMMLGGKSTRSPR